MSRQLLILITGLLIFISCSTKQNLSSEYATKNVVIVVIDGPRYSETWGDPEHQYIPRLSNELSKMGNVYTQFYNNGPTYTTAGHTAVITGKYQELNNKGKEIPEQPSLLQHWLKSTQKDKAKAWIVASKDKLEVLADCKDKSWSGKFNPLTSCGINGLGVGSGYRKDSLTFLRVMEVLETHKPNLLFVNFREPDYSGHKNKWNNYLKGIRDTDQYIYEIFQYIENDPNYAGTTTLFVTNDHGRHLDGIADGFIAHGDGCEGCRHINPYAAGPDFKKNGVVNIKREQIDIPTTAAKLLNIDFPTGNGKVMDELFLD